MRGDIEKFESGPKIVVYILAAVASILYLIYRITYTMPFSLRPVDIVIGLIVLVAELIENFEYIVHFWNVLRFKKVSPKTPNYKGEYPDVDVFVATLNEDESVLRETLKACKAMKYPQSKKVHIYLCDDGERDELKKLAREFGATYLARTKHDYAKAGNYNYALKNSDSPYVAIFDADMCPDKNFLMKTMPFFLKEEKVGFVQTPQAFKNPDIFQARFTTKLPLEQDYFYRYIQLARNNNNSVILCGTNCVISRQALSEAGNFALATIAEDIATGMLIEAKGYRGIAIADILAHGEAVNSTSGFLRQRSRWGCGCIQTAKAYGIFTVKGLTIRQKLDYFVSIKYWLFGVRRMFFMALPLIYVFFHVIAIEGDFRFFLPLFFTQYLLKRFVIDWAEDGRKSATWMKIHELIQAPYLMFVVLLELIGISNKKFSVTKKGKKAESKKGLADGLLFLAHWLMLMLNGLGLGVAIWKVMHERLELYIIPIIWISINICYLSIVLLFDIRNNRTPKNFKPDAKRKYGPMAMLGLLWRGK